MINCGLSGYCGPQLFDVLQSANDNELIEPYLRVSNPIDEFFEKD